MSHRLEIRSLNSFPCVYQRGFHAGVPQGTLNEFQGDSIIVQELSGRMAQAMWCEVYITFAGQAHLRKHGLYFFMKHGVGKTWKEFTFFDFGSTQVTSKMPGDDRKEDNGLLMAHVPTLAMDGQCKFLKINIGKLESFHFDGSETIVGHQGDNGFVFGRRGDSHQFVTLFFSKTFFVIELAGFGFYFHRQNIPQGLHTQVSERVLDLSLAHGQLMVRSNPVVYCPTAKRFKHVTVQGRGERGEFLAKYKLFDCKLLKMTKFTNPLKIIVENRSVGRERLFGSQAIKRWEASNRLFPSDHWSHE